MARVTVTEGADRLAFWASATTLPRYPEAFHALGAVYADIQRIRPVLSQRDSMPASVGLLYSTTTEVLEQAWVDSTSERWQHLHALEAIAYALLRANIPFEVVMERDVTPERLADLGALILPATRFLTASVARTLEAAASDRRLTVVAAGPHPALGGLIECAGDPLMWHRRVAAGYRQEVHLNEQWQDLEAHLLPLVRPAAAAPIRVFAEHAIAKAYRVADRALLVMIANWDLHRPRQAVIQGRGVATDLLSNRALGDLGTGLSLEIPAAGWRVLRVAVRPDS
jgi:hypothetical protein